MQAMPRLWFALVNLDHVNPYLMDDPARNCVTWA